MARLLASFAGGQNVLAFLDTIAVSEGTAGKGDDGYNVMVGGSLFTSYADHPTTKIFLERYRIWSSAAGRYQFISATWQELKAKLKLHDFEPVSQDEACVQLLKDCGAYSRIVAGDFDGAVRAAAQTWASFPGAGYGQHENRLDYLRNAYVAAGGTVGKTVAPALAPAAAPALSPLLTIVQVIMGIFRG